MDRSQVYCTAGLIALLLTPVHAWSAEPAKNTTHTITGIVMELRSGTSDVPVCLCDGVTGLPLARDSYQPIEWGKAQPGDAAKKMAIVVTDNKGQFRFEKVPNGKYRLVAQKWIGPYQGVFEEHGTVIQLMGSVDDVVVPRPTDYYKARVVLVPPGNRIVQFDQDVGNSDTFMFLSTSPPEFDPILGLNAMGTSFHQRLIGVNRMPLGKTTVIGAPDNPFYAFFFAPDNSPGFAAINVPASQSGLVRLSAEPFVAGWSDGRKSPPPRLAELMKFLDEHSLTTQDLLDIPQLSNATSQVYRARMQELTKELSRNVDLPESKSARVGDLLAVESFRRLNRTKR